jgi:hypothetical protein
MPVTRADGVSATAPSIAKKLANSATNHRTATLDMARMLPCGSR